MPKQLKRTYNTNRYAPYIKAATKLGGAVVRHAAKRAVQKWRSKTKAKPKLFYNVVPPMAGSSHSSYRKQYKGNLTKRILQRLTPERVMINRGSSRIEGTIGGQCVVQFPQLFDEDLKAMFTNLVDLPTSTTQEMYIKGIQQEFLMSNATNANLFVKIYECTARNDIYYSTNSSGAYTSEGQWTAIGSFDHGIYEMNASYNATTLGILPFASKLFCTQWNVDKVINVELGPGRSHIHNSRFSPRAFIKEPRVNRNKALKGITRFVMLVIYGAPINDNTTDTNVSTAKPALNVVRKESITIQHLASQGDKLLVSGALGGITGTGVLMSEEGVEQTVTES